MFTQLLQYNDVGLLLLRIAVASIFLYHGLPKLSRSKEMSQMMGMPAGMIFMLGIVETLASLGVVFGVYTQLSALLLAIVMIGAMGMKMTKWNVPFSAVDKTGWEFDFILLFASIAILLNGGGSIGL
ncbi:MAG: DoxX family protein [Candidatus Zambryskibacteria bacterium]|nr:DoxX family protein [Candidatus Zambryskibacteria bacterium]